MPGRRCFPETAVTKQHLTGSSIGSWKSDGQLPRPEDAGVGRKQGRCIKIIAVS